MKYKIGDFIIWLGSTPKNTVYGIILETDIDIATSEPLYYIYHSVFGRTMYPEWLLELSALTGKEYLEFHGK